MGIAVLRVLLRAHNRADRGGHAVREAEGDICRPGVYLDSLQRMANLPCGISWDACPALRCVDRVLGIEEGMPGGKMDSATSTFGLVERYQNRGKRHAEEMLRFRSASNPAGPDPVDPETPSRVFARREGVQILLKKLDDLPAEYREMILLAKFEGLTTKEISERVERSRESVALTLHRALKRFRELEAAAR